MEYYEFGQNRKILFLKLISEKFLAPELIIFKSLCCHIIVLVIVDFINT